MESGFSNHDVSALFPEKKQDSRDFADEQHTERARRRRSGGAIGAMMGLLAGIGALEILRLGPFIAAGPIRPR